MPLLETEHKIHRQYQKNAADNVVPPYLHLESHHRKKDKDHQRYYLLYYLELHQIKRTSVALETDSVGRDL